MTREEAIEKLEMMRQKVDEETYRALILAIKALEQPCDTENCKIVKALIGDPCKVKEPCDDAISREAVLKEFEKGTENLYGRIDKLPSVTPSRRKGHWILTIEDWRKYTCSECGWSKRTDIHISLGYDFCPNCGADMRGDTECLN